MQIDPKTVRVSTVLSALIYMMTRYSTDPSRALAQSIAEHLECLSCHSQIDPVIRHVAAGMGEQWEFTAGAAVPALGEAPSSYIH